jgi:hypothetical protein
MPLEDYGSFIRSGMSLVPDLQAQIDEKAKLGLDRERVAAQTMQARAQMAEVVQKLTRAQEFQRDLGAVGDNPDPTAISSLIMKYPEFADHLKQGWDLKDNAAKQADLTQLGEVYSAAASGNWPLALKQAQARVDADKAAGKADPEDQTFVDQITAAVGGDEGAKKAVLTTLGTHIAAVSGPEHFATVYGALKGGYTLGPGDVRLDDNGLIVGHSPMIKADDGSLYNWDDIMSGAATGSGKPATSAAQPASMSPAVQTVAATLSSAGLPAPVVAGFLGNFHAEGGYDGAQGDGGSASGIAQWHSDRAATFERVAGKPVTEATPEEQARFVAWEMKNPKAAGMTVAQRDAILNAKTAPQAAALIDKYYERSSGEDRQKRMEAAAAFAGQYGGNTGGPKPLLPGKPKDAPSGYRYSADGKSLEVIPGGPADPNGPKNQGPLKPQALEAATIAYAKTGKMPAGMGGQTVRNQILNYLPTIMDRYGLTPDDVPSIQQQFGADAATFKQRIGQLSYMRNSVGKLNQHAQDMSALIKAVPGQTSFKPFNWITQGVEGQFSNSAVTQLQAAIPLFQAEVARVMTGNPNSGAGQLSDDARHEFDVLGGTASPKAKIDAINRLMKMTQEAVKATRDESLSLKRRLGGGLDVYAGTAPEPAPTSPAQDEGWITLPSGLRIRKIK